MSEAEWDFKVVGTDLVGRKPNPARAFRAAAEAMAAQKPWLSHLQLLPGALPPTPAFYRALVALGRPCERAWGQAPQRQ